MRYGIVLAMTWLLACTTATAQDAAKEQNPLAELDWVTGPQTVQVGTRATLEVPEGYVLLHPKDTAKFQELLENFSSGQETLIAPDDLHWFGLLEFDDIGYVKDDEKIDKDQVLKSVTAGTEAGNKERRKRGWSELHVTGWRFEPRYDPVTKRLEWAIAAKAKEGPVVNFNTRVLGREGVTSATLVSDPTSLDAAVSEFKEVLTGYQYVAGHRYADVKQGDKMAEYGLAALIAGGGAAVAAKTGLLKGLMKLLIAGWKVVAVAVVGLLAGLGRFFTRKGTA